MAGQESEVIGLDCDERGIRVLKLTEGSGPVYRYDPPTVDSFGDQPLLSKSIASIHPFLLKMSRGIFSTKHFTNYTHVLTTYFFVTLPTLG